MLRSVLVGLTIVLVGGFVNPLMNLAQSAPTEGFRVLKYENLGADLATVLNATGAQYHDQYATYAVPDWFRRLLRGAGVEPLDRGELIIEAEYNVYLNGKELFTFAIHAVKRRQKLGSFSLYIPLILPCLKGANTTIKTSGFFGMGRGSEESA